MRVWAIAVVLAGCGDGGGDGQAPRVGEMCEESQAAPQCGLPVGSEDQPTIVAVCEDGVFVQGTMCPQGELCFTEESREAPACRDVNEFTIYGERDEPCLVDGTHACNFDETNTLLCQSGVWTLDENCSSDGSRCVTLRDIDDGCSDRNSCVVCAI